MLENLAKRLIRLRESLGLSQYEVAKRIGIDNSSLSRIESGDRKVSSDELAKFADQYNVTTDYLLGKSIPSECTTEPITFDLKDILDGIDSVSLVFDGKKLTVDEFAKFNFAITQIFWNKLRANESNMH